MDEALEARGMRSVQDIRVHTNFRQNNYAWCFKKSYTTLKAYINVFRGHTNQFSESQAFWTLSIVWNSK
jgi:hypothetical protein